MAKKKIISAPAIETGLREKRREKEQNYIFLASRVYVIFVLAVYPLLLGTEGYNNIVYSKASYYWAITITLFVIFLAFFLAHVLGENRQRWNIPWYKRFNITDYALFAYFFVIILSCVFSPYKGDLFVGYLGRYDGYLTVGLMIASFFVVSRWYKPNELDMTIFAAGSIVLCIIGFLQFYGFDFLNLFPYTQSNMLDPSGNPKYSGFSILFRSTLGNVDIVSTYTCITLAVFTVLYVRTKTPLRFLYFSASAMNFALMIIGNADAGKVGVLGMLIIAVPFWIADRKELGKLFLVVSTWGFTYVMHHWVVVNILFPTFNESSPMASLRKQKSYRSIPLLPLLILSLTGLAFGVLLIVIKNKKWFARKTTQIAGVAAILLVFTGAVAGIEVVGKALPERNMIHQAREMLHGNFHDSAGTYRVFIWKRALAKLPEQPLIGTGPDTFYMAFGEENQKESGEVTKTHFDKAHNDFIQIAFCYGIIGLICYLVFIASLLIKSVKPSYVSTFAFLSSCGVIAYLVQSFFGIDSVIVSPIFWILMGIAKGERARFENSDYTESF